MNKNKYVYTIVSSIIVSIFLMTGCSSENDPDPVSSTITGTVYDSFTTEPVAGITMAYGSASTTTNGSGAFTLEISGVPENGIIKDSFIMYGGDYAFMYIEELSIDPDNPPNPHIPVSPQSTSGYTTKELTGDFFFNDGTTEISMSSIIINISNGEKYYRASDLYFNGYSITTPVYGSDCLVSGYAALSTDPFMFLLPTLDLSGASPITLDITEPDPGDIDTISVTFNETGNTAKGMYDSSYGFIPITGRYLFDSGVGGEKTIISEILQSDQTTESVDIYNPETWPAFWEQKAEDLLFGQENIGHKKTYISTGTISAITGSVDLPAIDSSLGPDEPADEESLAFADDVLSQAAVDGADVFCYTIRDDDTGELLGEMISMGNKITLPDAVQTIFAGKSVQFNFTVRDYETVEFDFSFLEAFPSLPPDTQFGEISSASEAYEVVIDF